MAKHFVETINEVEYTFEFDRNSVVKMESIGFKLSDANDKVFTTVRNLMYGALVKHHDNIKWKEVEEVETYLLSEYGSEVVMDTLVELFQEVIQEPKTTKKIKILG